MAGMAGMMALSPMVLDAANNTKFTPYENLRFRTGHASFASLLPHDGVAGGVADFSLRSNERAINCATPERELKFATPYAMPQPNDVVMIDRARRRDNDICD